MPRDGAAVSCTSVLCELICLPVPHDTCRGLNPGPLVTVVNGKAAMARLIQPVNAPYKLPGTTYASKAYQLPFLMTFSNSSSSIVYLKLSTCNLLSLSRRNHDNLLVLPIDLPPAHYRHQHHN